MKELLIVDGYNIINAWPELRDLMPLGLDVARQALVDILSDYGASHGVEVTIVFDAQTQPGPAREQHFSGVTVVFSASGETADSAIERMVQRSQSKNCWVRVATSDHLEQSVVLGFGATRISARELRQMVQDTRKHQAHYLGKRQVKTHPLPARLPADVAQALERFRRGKG